MRPARLPPISKSNQGNPMQNQPAQAPRRNSSKSKVTRSCANPGREESDYKRNNLPTLPCKQNDEYGSVGKPGSSHSDSMPLGKQTAHKLPGDTGVPFLPERDQSSTSAPNRDNFNDIISPPTPPKITVDHGDGPSLLKRRQQSPNCLLQSQTSKSHDFKESLDVPIPSRPSGCRSAGELRKRGTASEPPLSMGRSFSLFTFKQFRAEVEKWKKNKKVNKLQEFYRAAFDSFKSINDAFKKVRSSVSSSSTRTDKSVGSMHTALPTYIADPSLQQKYVGFVYETLLEMPRETQKIMLKGIINCLLNEWKGEKSESDLRAYFVLFQNPMFTRVETFVVYAHLLRQIATLNENDQIIMTQWFRRLSTPRFRPLVERLHQFATLRLFPGQSEELPSMSNCGWWIPSAIKVLSLLNNANNLVKPRLISFREFYNHSLDHIDVMAEFRQWENPASHSGFTFCQFPFILSLVAKLRILRHDQERQMIRTARDELVTSIRRRPTRAPCVSQLFLNITVRRQHLLQDSLEQIYGNRKQLKKKLRVEFVGEPGYDMGGLTKEWFLLLLRKVLSPDYNTFTYNKKSGCYWFADNASENSSDLFLVGVLMGLAVYNCITLDIRLPMVCYRKLLSSAPRNTPPITHPADSHGSSPTSSSNQAKPVAGLPKPAPSAGIVAAASSQPPIGAVAVNLEDYRSVDPDMARGLDDLLSYEGNVDDDFGLTFQTSQEDFGVLRTIPLKSGGEKMAVTNKNRTEYVQALLNYKLNKSVYRQFLAFYHGFYTVCSSNALSFLCPEELETLVCGNSGFDIRDLKKYTTYQGYVNNDPTVLHFWDVLLSLSRDLQKRFLHFCTGSDRVPVGGMQELNFKIVRTPTAQNMLPMAHTCFNQLLLPPYGSKAQLEAKLVIAISNAEGFGLE